MATAQRADRFMNGVVKHIGSLALADVSDAQNVLRAEMLHLAHEQARTATEQLQDFRADVNARLEALAHDTAVLSSPHVALVWRPGSTSDEGEQQTPPLGWHVCSKPATAASLQVDVGADGNAGSSSGMAQDAMLLCRGSAQVEEAPRHHTGHERVNSEASK